MRLSTLCAAALLTIGSIGLANATPSITNGDFSSATPPYNGPTQFGTGGGSVNNGTGSNCTWGGQFVSGWSGNGGYNMWYSSAAAASGTNACTQYGLGSTGDGTGQRLPGAVTAPPIGSGSFVGLDGQSGIAGSISQTLNGLTAGAKYIVSFYWGATQEMSTQGGTSQYLAVSLGGQTFNTPTVNIGTHDFSGWMMQSFTFTPGSSSETLNFLSYGQPGLPPFALLTGISISQNVPEPPVLALFGSGLLGLGLLTVFARRRALRHQA